MKTRIKEMRLIANMTQEILAKKSGIDIKQVQRIEKGTCNPRIDTIIKIAVALETTVGYLLYEENAVANTAMLNTASENKQL